MSNLRAVWSLPLALLSFLFFKSMKAVIGALLTRQVRKKPDLRWHPLSAELLRLPGATGVYMTQGPRWNTHAVIASAGPFEVESELQLQVAAAGRSARSWSLVIYSFPGTRTVASIASAAAPAADGEWRSLPLEPGEYTINLRYYGWGPEAELPAVKADGRRILEPAAVPPGVNEFYQDLRRQKSWFYSWLHYYVFVMLRFRRWLPSSFVRREYLPVGDPENDFLYDLLHQGEQVALEVDPDLLRDGGAVYFTQYDRASFPVLWYQVDEPRHSTAPSQEDGFYLIRIPRTAAMAGETAAARVRATALPAGRQAARG